MDPSEIGLRDVTAVLRETQLHTIQYNTIASEYQPKNISTNRNCPDHQLCWASFVMRMCKRVTSYDSRFHFLLDQERLHVRASGGITFSKSSYKPDSSNHIWSHFAKWRRRNTKTLFSVKISSAPKFIMACLLALMTIISLIWLLIMTWALALPHLMKHRLANQGQGTSYSITRLKSQDYVTVQPYTLGLSHYSRITSRWRMLWAESPSRLQIRRSANFAGAVALALKKVNFYQHLNTACIAAMTSLHGW